MVTEERCKMKIIATIDSDTFMVEASKSELALLCGFRNYYDDGFAKIPLKAGLELDLKKMATTSEFIRNIDKDRLQKIKATLASTITDIDKAVENIQAVTLLETLKEDIQ